ncbi:MAG: ABC transporter ATP-binding protein [Rhodospirillaceae bacterium TMED8]|nr:ABC transporter ATP-binding protein [Magnetovibrio sp.]OUT49033.1 MAG: ABC transporter ATP-binding protein [Rhodospirillaceae bacterium TMED8]|tara:strand:- start:1574 stop:2293 length:720 start_codon:yes stop_codon:yes gene_type:complete
MSLLLELSAVEASYGVIRALQGVSLEVGDGDMVALLGANGAGKSTTLRSISGMVPPTSGQILFDGKSLAGLTPNEIVKLGIAHVPEGRKIFKDLTVSENLRMGAYSRSDKTGIIEDTDMVLNLFPRLKEREGQLGGSLSGGEQQMLAIGRGLMARPRLLLLDEPSLGLAPIIIADIFTTLKAVNAERRMTMLIVEQNANVALKNCHFGYVLRVGKVAVSGESEKLRTNREVVESYLGVH